MAPSTGWYDAHAPDLVGRYEAVNPAGLHNWLRVLLPDAPGTVLDIGAGSGRDAGWFSAQGYDVVAVEPSSGMRSEGQRLHPDPRIRWINDQLPDLSILGPLAISFDVVMLTAVWQHVPPSQRDRAFRKIAALVRSGGLLAISLTERAFSGGERDVPGVLGRDRAPRPEPRLRRREGSATRQQGGVMSRGRALRFGCRMMAPARFRCSAMSS